MGLGRETLEHEAPGCAYAKSAEGGVAGAKVEG